VYDRLSQIPTPLSNAAQEAAALPSPAATDTSETICFPSCGVTMQGGSALTAYIAANGTGLSGSAARGSSYASFTGALLIPASGIYSFCLYSDDGASLTIGGQTLIDVENPQTWVGASASVHFAQTGLHAIEIAQFDIDGYTGITLIENDAAIPVADPY
jgi:hypothetical protein